MVTPAPACAGHTRRSDARSSPRVRWTSKTKQLIAVAVAHNTGCSTCIDGHTSLAARAGATSQEIMESIWVAAEVHAGGTFAHPTRALQA